MSVQAVNQSALAPAAKGVSIGSGQANDSPRVDVPGRAAEAEGSMVVQPLLKQQIKEVKVQPPVTTNLQFTVDLEHKRVFIRISDSRTGRVIIEAPPEKIARAMDQLLANSTGSEIDVEV